MASDKDNPDYEPGQQESRNTNPLPDASDISEMKLRLDRPAPAIQEFDVPKGHWRNILESLTPARIDAHPENLEVFGGMEITTNQGASIVVDFCESHDDPGVYAVEKNDGTRTFYRGGSTGTTVAFIRRGGWVGCSCYYNSDCGWLRYCGGWWCGDSPSKNDGFCDTFNWPGQPDPPRASLADALDLRLRAYEVALERNGGPPDTGLMQEALALPLTPESHTDLKGVAAFVQVMLHGLHHKGWSFIPPKRKTDGGGSSDFGSLRFKDGQAQTPLGVAQIVRAAMVVETREPGQGVYQNAMKLIRSDFPSFKPVHRCEHPHPKEHGHLFPFKDGVECLIVQLRGPLDILQAGEDVARLRGAQTL